MKKLIYLAVSVFFVASCQNTTNFMEEKSGTAENKIEEEIHTGPEHIMVSPEEIKWVEGPNSLPTGSMMAVIEGDPSKDDLFTMRLKFPAGYSIKPHFHPIHEHVTLLEGDAFMGMGEKYDESTATEIKLGGFAMMAPGIKHYAFTKGGCVIQLHGYGKWGITYVNPEDDPRNKK